jgi:hypothetical protein
MIRYMIETLAELTALTLFILMLGTWAGYLAGV